MTTQFLHGLHDPEKLALPWHIGRCPQKGKMGQLYRSLLSLFPFPPVERLESGYHVFVVVYLSRGTLPTKKGEKEHLAGAPSFAASFFEVVGFPLEFWMQDTLVSMAPSPDIACVSIGVLVSFTDRAMFHNHAWIDLFCLIVWLVICFRSAPSKPSLAVLASSGSLGLVPKWRSCTWSTMARAVLMALEAFRAFTMEAPRCCISCQADPFFSERMGEQKGDQTFCVCR